MEGLFTTLTKYREITTKVVLFSNLINSCMLFSDHIDLDDVAKDPDFEISSEEAESSDKDSLGIMTYC